MAHTAWPQSSHSHTGMGVAKTLCLLRTQSHSRELAQSLSLVFMNSGCHWIWSALSRILSLNSTVLRNHWGTCRYSMGVWHLQQMETCWGLSFCSTRMPWSLRSWMAASRASATFMPAYLPASSVILPISSIPFSSGKWYFMTHSRSSLSPMVQIMTNPVPYSIWTLGSEMTFTRLPNRGVTSSFPTRWAFSLSSGWTATAWQVQSSSGLVVAMRT